MVVCFRKIMLKLVEHVKNGILSDTSKGFMFRSLGR